MELKATIQEAIELACMTLLETMTQEETSNFGAPVDVLLNKETIHRSIRVIQQGNEARVQLSWTVENFQRRWSLLLDCVPVLTVAECSAVLSTLCWLIETYEDDHMKKLLVLHGIKDLEV